MEEEVKKYAKWVYDLLQGDDSEADEMWYSLESDGYVDDRSQVWLGDDDDDQS